MEKRNADHKSHSGHSTTSSAPPGSTQPNPTQCTHHDPSTPHPPVAGATTGGQGIERINDNEVDRAGGGDHKLAFLYRGQGKVRTKVSFVSYFIFVDTRDKEPPIRQWFVRRFLSAHIPWLGPSISWAQGDHPSPRAGPDETHKKVELSVRIDLFVVVGPQFKLIVKSGLGVWQALKT
jgi:hypothetical protein